jgi:hypothetical protein
VRIGFLAAIGGAVCRCDVGRRRRFPSSAALSRNSDFCVGRRIAAYLRRHVDAGEDYFANGKRWGAPPRERRQRFKMRAPARTAIAHAALSRDRHNARRGPYLCSRQNGGQKLKLLLLTLTSDACLPLAYSIRSAMPRHSAKQLKTLAHPARFELTASAFGGQRSIQLSYGCFKRQSTHERQKVKHTRSLSCRMVVE